MLLVYTVSSMKGYETEEPYEQHLFKTHLSPPDTNKDPPPNPKQ